MGFTLLAVFLSLLAVSCGQSEAPTSSAAAAVESSEMMSGSASASTAGPHSSSIHSMSMQASESSAPTTPLDQASSSYTGDMHSSSTMAMSSSVVMESSAASDQQVTGASDKMHSSSDSKMPSSSSGEVMMSSAHSSSHMMSSSMHPSQGMTSSSTEASSGMMSSSAQSTSSMDTSSQIMMSSTDATSAHTSSQMMSSAHTSSQMMSSAHTSSQMMSSADTSSQMMSSAHTSSQMMSSAHTSSQMMSSADTSSQMMSSRHTSSAMTSSMHTSSQVTMSSSAGTTSEMMSSAHTSSQMMSSQMTSSDHASVPQVVSSTHMSSSVMMSSMHPSSSSTMMSSDHSSMTIMPTTEMPPVPKKENISAVLTFAGDCKILTDNETLEIDFKEQLKNHLLKNLTSPTTIFVGAISCGSVKAEVTFVNAERPMVTAHLNNLDDSFVITSPGGGTNFAFTSAQVQAPPPPPATPPPPKGKPAPAPVQSPDLKIVDIIIIVVCAVVFTCCVLFGIIYCCVSCYQKRYTKTFELGETPSRHIVNSDEFTLTRLDRPTPLYNEKGPVITTDPVHDPVHDSTLYTTNSFLPEDRQTFSSFRKGDVEANKPSEDIEEIPEKRLSRQNLVHVNNTKSGIDNPSFSNDEILDSAKHSPQSESRSNNNSISPTHDSGTGTLEKRSDVDLVVVNDDSSSHSSKHSVEVVNEYPEDEQVIHTVILPEPDRMVDEVHYDNPVTTIVSHPDPVLEHHYDTPDDPTVFVVTTDVGNDESPYEHHSDSSDEPTSFVVITGVGDDEPAFEPSYDRPDAVVTEVGQDGGELVQEYEPGVEASMDFPPPPPPDDMVASVEFIDMVDDHIVIESPMPTQRHPDEIDPPMEFSSDTNVTTIVIDSSPHQPHDLHNIPEDSEVVIVDTAKRHSRSSSISSSSSRNSSKSDSGEGKQHSYNVSVTSVGQFDEDATGF